MGQHYVPQHHLRQFAAPSDSDKIWMYEKGTGACRLLPIRNVAQSGDFYKEADERALSEKIEGPAQKPLEKLRRGHQIDSTGRAAVALYLESMIKRVPHTRRKMLDIVGPVTDGMIERIRNNHEAEALKWGVTPAQILEAVDEFERDFRRRDISMKDDFIRFQWSTRRFVEHISSMTWRVIRVDFPNGFLTGDNPVFFHEGYGLKRPGGEFSFPFASGAALHGSWQQAKDGPLTFVDGRPRHVKEFNRRAVSGADRFVFYCRETAWVRQLTMKPHPRTEPLRW